MDKKTLIVNYFGMSTGGIEKYIADLMLYCVKEGHRVIWFTIELNHDDIKQPGIADNPNIEKVVFAGGRRKFLRKLPSFNLTEEENVVMISFVPEDYVWAEQFRYKYKCKTFYHHLILMNFFGWLTYPEDEFKIKFLSLKRASLSNEIANKLDANDNIRAFADKQLQAFKDRYDLKYKVSNEMTLKSMKIQEKIPDDDLREKAQRRQEEFVLVTCARFQFPHKGYLIGLLDVFKEFKNKYPNSKLVIIGDGEMDVFMEHFNKLPVDIRNSIELKGTVTFDETVAEYRKATAFIGLAGAASTAASIGLPTLIVRHDTMNCEVNGFYHETATTLMSEPGNDALPYLEKIMDMSEDEYVELGNLIRENYLTRSTINPGYILDQTNKTSNPSVDKRDMRRNKEWAMISLMKQKFFSFL